MHSSMSAVLTSPAHCGGKSGNPQSSQHTTRCTTMDHGLILVRIPVPVPAFVYIVVPGKRRLTPRNRTHRVEDVDIIVPNALHNRHLCLSRGRLVDVSASEGDPESEVISAGVVPPAPSSSCTLLLPPLRASAPAFSSLSTSSVTRTSKNQADRTGTYRLAMSWASSG